MTDSARRDGRVGAAPALCPIRIARWSAALLLVLLTAAETLAYRGEIILPEPTREEPIAVLADRAYRWQQGSYEVWLLDGNCLLKQGNATAGARQAVLWIERQPQRGTQPDKVLIYLENNARLSFPGEQTLIASSWFGRFYTTGGVQVQIPVPLEEPVDKPAVYYRAVAARSPEAIGAVRPAQFLSGGSAAPGPVPLQPVMPLPKQGLRSIRVQSRSNARMQAEGHLNSNGQGVVASITSGVNIVIDGGDDPLGLIDISADRLVIWTPSLEMPDLKGEVPQPKDYPLELYMEGNIVFRQGDRQIHAQRMYYNVAQELGVILDAEMFTPIPNYRGILRVKAEVVQQMNRENFLASGASITTSRLGVPEYWFQSEQIHLQDIQQPSVNPFDGSLRYDEQTGRPLVGHQLLATSVNNFVYLHEWPIFYWPRFETDLRKPSYYLDRIQVGNDNVFGTQVATSWDMQQLLGFSCPNLDWTAQLDVLTERGVGAGTMVGYEGPGCLGLGGDYLGDWKAWGLRDSGLDNLGEGRRAVPPETDWRGRVVGTHRHRFGDGYEFDAEFGAISDRNFLEEYFEEEWDERKDESTDLWLQRNYENQSWVVLGSARLDDFFTQTQWLPRADHFTIGQSLLWDRLTWTEHSHIGYAQMETAVAPTDPTEAAQFAPLPWEGAWGSTHEGVVAATRHELSLPLQLGTVKVTPYALGELATWGEDLNGDSLNRAYGQLGLRTSLPMWRVDPTVQSELWNLNGIAHKVVWEADLFWADASRDLDQLPLYNPLDDDSIEAFRRWNLVDNPLLGTRPFDARYYALRTGMQGWVTTPNTEIVDDLMIARLGVRQRWQTKRGSPGAEHIVDWITLDLQTSLFPDPDRDNYGQVLGLTEYDFRWHVGDRLTLLSDGMFDFFDHGLKTVNIGGLISRPEYGSAYLGYRAIQGPIVSNIVSASVSYRMSPKWIARLGTAIDLSDTGNIGQSFDITRVGESFLISVGLNIDSGRDSVGVHLAIEPRFLAPTRRSMLGGVPIAPAGTYWLE